MKTEFRLEPERVETELEGRTLLRPILDIVFYPTKTVHYQGNGRFMTSGSKIFLRRKFKPEKL